MGHKHERADLLAGAVAVAREQGLNQVTFGTVARHVGISDRMVVYYFPTKAALVTEVLVALGSELRTVLVEAFPSRASNWSELVRGAWPVVSRSDHDSTFRLFFQAIGIAAAGAEPYAGLAPMLLEEWITWLAERVDGPARRRRTEAEAAVAVLDGLLVVRTLAGAAAADSAAARVTSS
jgi:AcrR family transcriptional regulator